MANEREKAHSHPYTNYESQELWRKLDEAIQALVTNGDLVEQTDHNYIVGYLCKVLNEK
jgi:hypothetical protein